MTSEYQQIVDFQLAAMANTEAPLVHRSYDRRATVIQSVIPVAVLATIAVACRFHSKTLTKQQVAAHDYCIVGGLFLARSCVAVNIISALQGTHLVAKPWHKHSYNIIDYANSFFQK